MLNREQGKTDILQGTLDILVLQTLTTLGPIRLLRDSSKCQTARYASIWGHCIQDSCVWNNADSCEVNGV